MKKLGTALALALVVSLVMASVALAAQVLTVTPTRTEITAGQPNWLRVTTAEAVAETITVEYRVPDGAWQPFRRSISASRAAEATSFVIPFKPAFNSGWRVVQGGVASEPTTVSVKAWLSQPIAARTMHRKHRHVVTLRHGKRSLESTYVPTTVKGFIKPKHAVGSQPIVLTLFKKVDGQWVEYATLSPTIVGNGDFGSKWSVKWTPEQGLWKFQASHEDVLHTKSYSKPLFVRVK